jgi:exodeoxyribonuclease-3
MKIVSWNVNGVRALEKKGFAQWIAKNSPDILCLQETKANPSQLKDALKAPLDANGVPYKSYWASAKKLGYSGVAIFSKTAPLDVMVMGEDAFDCEGRVLQADFGIFIVISAYFPNSQAAGARLGYKLEFCDAIMALCKKHIKNGRHIILSGDYNIAHKPIDLSNPRENEGNAGFLIEERQWMDKWTGGGFVDSFRYFYPDLKEQYSWWSYRMHARLRNIGWRLDYNCFDEGFTSSVKSAKILSEIEGSDHCPVEIVVEP